MHAYKVHSYKKPISHTELSILALCLYYREDHCVGVDKKASVISFNTKELFT